MERRRRSAPSPSAANMNGGSEEKYHSAPHHHHSRQRCFLVSWLCFIVGSLLLSVTVSTPASHPVTMHNNTPMPHSHPFVSSYVPLWSHLRRLNDDKLVPHKAASRTLREKLSVDVKIWVYPLPAEFNTDLTQESRMLDRHGHCTCCTLYHGAEVSFHEQLQQSPFVTDNPDEADFFYVPVYPACLVKNRANVAGFPDLHSTAAFLNRALSWIQNNYPFWSRSGGADHVWMFAQGHGGGLMGEFLDSIRHSVFLVTNGQPSERTFLSWKDIPVPSLHGHTPNILSYTSKRSFQLEKRAQLLYWGGILHPDMRHSRGVRQWLRDQVHNQSSPWHASDVVFQASPSHHTDVYDPMSHSKFCLCLEGWWSWTPRLFESILSGCVPVLVSEDLQLPFDRFLDWTRFSIKISPDRLPELPNYLREVPTGELERIRGALWDAWRWLHWPLSYSTGHALDLVAGELQIRKIFRQQNFVFGDVSTPVTPQPHTTSSAAVARLHKPAYDEEWTHDIHTLQRDSETGLPAPIGHVLDGVNTSVALHIARKLTRMGAPLLSSADELRVAPAANHTSGFTLAVLAHSRRRALHTTVMHYCDAFPGTLHQVLIVWNDPSSPPPDADSYACGPHITVSVLAMRINSMNNRFSKDLLVHLPDASDIVLAVDSDVIVDPLMVSRAFDVMEASAKPKGGPLVGFTAIDSSDGTILDVSSSDAEYDMLSSSAIFLRRAHIEAYNANPRGLITVDVRFTCDSHLINFAVSVMGGHAPIWVRSRPQQISSTRPLFSDTGRAKVHRECMEEMVGIFGNVLVRGNAATTVDSIPSYFLPLPLVKESAVLHRPRVLWRRDKRCGSEFPLQDGTPSQCDPTSIYPCCSDYGWCGNTKESCACKHCTDYREVPATNDLLSTCSLPRSTRAAPTCADDRRFCHAPLPSVVRQEQRSRAAACTHATYTENVLSFDEDGVHRVSGVTLVAPGNTVRYLMQMDYSTPLNADFEQDDITISLQGSVDRLQVLEQVATVWEGPISFAMFLSGTEDELALQQFLQHNPVVSSSVYVHTVRRVRPTPYVFDEHEQHYRTLYPINMMRNIALQGIRTDFVFQVDIDVLPSAPHAVFKRHLREVMHEAETVGCCGLAAFIVPAFETAESLIEDLASDRRHTRLEGADTMWQPLVSKHELIGKLLALEAMPMHLYYPPAYITTDYVQWLTTNSLYQVSYRPRFEPYYIAAWPPPPFNESFVNRGSNWAQHTYELHSAGYTLHVLPKVFGLDRIHDEHSTRTRAQMIPRAQQDELWADTIRHVDGVYGVEFWQGRLSGDTRTKAYNQYTKESRQVAAHFQRDAPFLSSLAAQHALRSVDNDRISRNVGRVPGAADDRAPLVE